MRDGYDEKVIGDESIHQHERKPAEHELARLRGVGGVRMRGFSTARQMHEESARF
jgi:hypothetical protein